MTEVFSTFRDIDGSFIREFQTAGFSARVFELALFAYFLEYNVLVERSWVAPDFLIKGLHPAAVEATTTNRAQGEEPDDLTYRQLAREDLPEEEKEFVFQIGKAIRRKLLKRDASGLAYWEQEQVVGKPFLVAVGAFHDQHSQYFGVGTVAEYLYGFRSVATRDDRGLLNLRSEPIGQHQFKGKEIPSGLFRLPEAECLSGVLFSNAHTVAIFNRIGNERGYGSEEVALCRLGTAYDSNPNASIPELFGYVVGDRPAEDLESFAEGLHLFINPWAKIPVSPEAFPNVTFHTLAADGNLDSRYFNSFQPIASITYTFVGQGASSFARVRQRAFLSSDTPST